jgi:hypothetical protein
MDFISVAIAQGLGIFNAALGDSALRDPQQDRSAQPPQ